VQFAISKSSGKKVLFYTNVVVKQISSVFRGQIFRWSTFVHQQKPQHCSL